MAQEADLKSVGLIAYGFESRLRYHLIKKKSNGEIESQDIYVRKIEE